MRASLDAGLTLEVAGARVPVTLRVNPRARRLILRVAQGTREVVVVAPSRRELKDALAFANRQARWIEARLAEQAPPVALVAGVEVPILGRAHAIIHAPQARGGVWIEEGEGPRLCISGAAPHVARRAEDFLKRLARAHLQSARAFIARSSASRCRGFRSAIRRRAGARAARRAGFPSRGALVLAPPHVLDYVAAHEASHLVHMNHSKAFWRLLATLVPDVRGPVRWLAREGRELHRYGRGHAG
ncbi:MAG: YgjP-like metallopeptidase domain-containing protein [Alphaproteobacteria bacterium]